MPTRPATAAVSAYATILLVVSSALPVHAQNAASLVARSADESTAAPAEHSVTVEERDIVKDLLHDQKDIWTSPFHIRANDAKWLLPVFAGTVVLISTDRRVNAEVAEVNADLTASRRISYLGSAPTLTAAAGGLYLVGKLTHNERARATGLLGIEALIDELVVVTALKQATNRERPDKVTGRQDFWDGGNAFPSGHAAASWAFAEVVAEKYHDKPVVRWGAYGLAAAVSVARVTSRKHSPSDVWIGGLVGFLVGRQVVRRATDAHGEPRVTFAPVVNPSTRTVGAAATFSF